VPLKHRRRDGGIGPGGRVSAARPWNVPNLSLLTQTRRRRPTALVRQPRGRRGTPSGPGRAGSRLTSRSHRVIGRLRSNPPIYSCFPASATSAMLQGRWSRPGGPVAGRSSGIQRPTRNGCCPTDPGRSQTARPVLEVGAQHAPTTWENSAVYTGRLCGEWSATGRQDTRIGPHPRCGADAAAGPRPG